MRHASPPTLLKLRHALIEIANASRERLGTPLLRDTKAASRARAIDALLATAVCTQTKHGPIRFLNHGLGSCKRAEVLLHKEPDSLKWIDRMEPGTVFWDIGANVGTLSLYAAARGDLDVLAFEPAAVNYYNLAANCELNGFTSRMHCLLMGFGGANEIAELHVSQFYACSVILFYRGRKNQSHRVKLRRYGLSTTFSITISCRVRITSRSTCLD